MLGITPGEYHVYAFPHDVRVDERDPDSTKPYEKYGKAVKLAEGDRQTVDLKPAPVEE